MISKELLITSYGKIDLFEASGSSIIALVFNNIVESDQLLDKGPTRFLLRQGISVIRFTSNTLDWHQNIPCEFIETLASFIEQRPEKSRIAIGHSMGGYAAIAFSKIFTIDKCISYAPQFNPDIFPDYRFVHGLENVNVWRYSIDKKTISNKCRYYIVYDSRDRDKLHAETIKKFIPNHNYYELELPYASHEITAHLHDLNQLKTVTMNLLNGTLPNLNEVRINRIMSPRYVRSICQVLAYYQKLAKLQFIKERLDVIQKNQLSNQAIFFQNLGDKYSQRLMKNISEGIMIVDQQIRNCDEIINLKSKGFDEQEYSERYQDVKYSQMDAVFHYVAYGKKEGRVYSLKVS